MRDQNVATGWGAAGGTDYVIISENPFTVSTLWRSPSVHANYPLHVDKNICQKNMEPSCILTFYAMLVIVWGNG